MSGPKDRPRAGPCWLAPNGRSHSGDEDHYAALPPPSLARCTASPSHTIPSKLRHGHQHTQSPPSLRPSSRSRSSQLCWNETSCQCKVQNRVDTITHVLENLCEQGKKVPGTSPPFPFFLGAFPVRVLPQDASRRNPALSKISSSSSSSQMAKCLRCAAALLNNSEFKVGRLDAIVRLDLKGAWNCPVQLGHRSRFCDCAFECESANKKRAHSPPNHNTPFV